MAVTEVLHALGSFDIKLSGDVPREFLDGLDYFGHVAIVPGRVNTVQAGDNSLSAARYVGVVRKKKIDSGDESEFGDEVSIGGVGVAFWLGDDDADRGKGAIYETPKTFSNSTFADTVRVLLPVAVTEGTLYSVSGTYTGQHQYETPRTAIQYVCDTMSTNSVPVSWRVNNSGTLDAGPEADLYKITPECIVVRRGFGEDVSMRALKGSMNVDQDVEDFSTRVVLIAEGEGSTVATAVKDVDDFDPTLNPYKDLHGNKLKLTRIVSESETSTGNAEARAQLQLNRFTGTRDALTLSADDYDINGTFKVGDYIWVYDPDAGLVDTNNEVYFRGVRLNPVKLQVHETSWNITEGYSVGYRDLDGNWFDLTDYVEFDSDSDSKIVVGEFSRTLSVSSGQSVGTRPDADTSTPDMPTWTSPFQTVNYQDDLGFTRSRVLLEWDAPSNTDGSTVLDGDHYEIQLRVDTDAIYPQTWSSISSTSWTDVNSWSQPFTPALSAWQTFYVAWGESTYFLNDLATGVGYDVRIRLVDKAGNTGEWQETTFVTTQDNLAPSTPAAPSVAGSRIAVQITHELGKATGGTFNLEQDLAHLEIHVDYEPHFTPSDTTLKGQVLANQGMITAQIPAVATVQVEETSTRYVRVIAVDRAGNKSLPSEAASADALLIDDAHISDLTVSKVTAGTISADFLLGASIKTGSTGARVELNQDGIGAWNSAGQQTVTIGSDGNVSIIGSFMSGPVGSSKRVVMNPGNTGLPEIRFYSNNGEEYGGINGASSANDDDQEVAMGMFSSTWDNGNDVPSQSRIRLYKGGGTYEVIKYEDQSRLGGYMAVTEGAAELGYAEGSTKYGRTYTEKDSVWSFLDGTGTQVGLETTAAQIFYKRGTSDEQGFTFSDATRHYGTWPDFVNLGSRAGIFSGRASPAGGVTSYTVGYGTTMASNMRPMVTIEDDVVHSNAVTGNAGTPTNFTVTISPGISGGGGVITFWCFRV